MVIKNMEKLIKKLNENGTIHITYKECTLQLIKKLIRMNGVWIDPDSTKQTVLIFKNCVLCGQIATERDICDDCWEMEKGLNLEQLV